MNIREIYKKYKIMPTLQQHMLRVAAVAKIICDNSLEIVDTENAITAMLLHDMGNIIKFNLSLYPEFLEPEGVDYWENVKAEFIEKYGNDEHDATHLIAREIGVSERVMKLLESVGFGQSSRISASDDLASKICNYSDQRVTPFGISSLRERIESGRERYLKNKGIAKNDIFEEGAASLEKIEKEIFQKSKIKPSDVDDIWVNKVIESGELEVYFS